MNWALKDLWDQSSGKRRENQDQRVAPTIAQADSMELVHPEGAAEELRAKLVARDQEIDRLRAELTARDEEKEEFRQSPQAKTYQPSKLHQDEIVEKSLSYYDINREFYGFFPIKDNMFKFMIEVASHLSPGKVLNEGQIESSMWKDFTKKRPEASRAGRRKSQKSKASKKSSVRIIR